jgi:transposase
MPRKSPFKIVLTEDEKMELERMARKYTGPYFTVVRAKIILLAAQGLSNKLIAERLDLPRQIVSKWRKRFFEKRLDGLSDNPRAGRPAQFSPEEVVTVKAIACELPARKGLPLSRFSRGDLKRYVEKVGLISKISAITIWRWLRADAIKPWQYRSWLFPRDPQFSAKADPILDLYQKISQGLPLDAADYVLSTDEKTSIQARKRKAETDPTSPNRTKRVEAEYERKGALAYLAAWDVHRAKIFGRCELKTGIKSFERLVDQVMSQEPYRSARRVFWIMDNGSSHRGQPSNDRLTKKWKNIIPVHTPVHALAFTRIFMWTHRFL